MQGALIFLAGLGIGVVAQLKGGAVGGEAATQTRSHAGSKVATHRGSAKKHHVGLLFLDYFKHHSKMRQGAIGRQTGVVGKENLVDTVWIEFSSHALYVAASNYSLKMTIHLGGQMATFGAELETDVGNVVGLCQFAIY